MRRPGHGVTASGTEVADGARGELGRGAGGCPGRRPSVGSIAGDLVDVSVRASTAAHRPSAGGSRGLLAGGSTASRVVHATVPLPIRLAITIATSDASPQAAARRDAMDIDPLNAGEKEPARLLAGKIRMTIVAGRIVKKSPEFWVMSRHGVPLHGLACLSSAEREAMGD